MSSHGIQPNAGFLILTPTETNRYFVVFINNQVILTCAIL